MSVLVIMCLAILATAAPQGYNYPNQQQFSPNSGFNIHSTLGRNFQQERKQQQPVISTRYFIHSAPQDEEEAVQQKDVYVGQPRKNYNVIFVKAPVSPALKTKIRVIPAVQEEQTAVYVLAKKAGENEVIANVEEIDSSTTKPQVYFVKYSTNEEAEYAQRTIQADYDRLGGSSDIINEGIASVSSVGGSVLGQVTDFGSLISNSGLSLYNGNNGLGLVTSAAPTDQGSLNAAYLPPVKKI